MPAPARPRRLTAPGLDLSFDRTCIMGVLNVTPDSFSDGGRSAAPAQAIANALCLAGEGAEILDIGGESTRPGHVPLTAEAEWARVEPVFAGLAQAGPLPPLSIDTWKAEVAQKALAAGARIVNDIWGLQRDPRIADVAAEAEAAVIVMHNRETIDPTLDILADMRAFFARALERAEAAGIPAARVILDPGIGFGKSPQQNLEALARLAELHALGQPLLLGASRKSFIGRLHPSTPQERLPGSIAAHVAGILAGVQIIRVHDVAAHVQAARVAEAIRAHQK